MPRTIVVALEGERSTVGRPGRLARFQQFGCDSFRFAAGKRKDPDAAEQIDRNGAPVRRGGRRHRRACVIVRSI